MSPEYIFEQFYINSQWWNQLTEIWVFSIPKVKSFQKKLVVYNDHFLFNDLPSDIRDTYRYPIFKYITIFSFNSSEKNTE